MKMLSDLLKALFCAIFIIISICILSNLFDCNRDGFIIVEQEVTDENTNT